MMIEREGQVLHYLVDDDDEQVRIDVFLTSKGAAESRSAVRRLLDLALVEVNGTAARPSYRVKAGDEIRVQLPELQPAKALPQEIPLDIVYEDEFLVVVNKPKGMVVHPAPGHADGTLVNALLHRYPVMTGVGGVLRPGIVHRLDKETSGLMVVALTHETHQRLVEALKAREVIRTYVALVHGRVNVDRGIIDAPIGRHPVDRKKMAVVENGKEALTHFWTVKRFHKYTLVRAQLETGRTHQIRVHMAHIGHPVAGDLRYGGRADLFDHGQALHSQELAFKHPMTNQPLSFTAPPPPGFQRVIDSLR